MMSWLSASRDIQYDDTQWHDSKTRPGVRFSIRRVSLSQRIVLLERLNALAQRYEFLRAGDALERAEASLAELLTKKLYLEWSLESIQGLQINGEPANVGSLVDRGPEDLCDEIVVAIRGTLELSEQERKNS